MVPVTTLLNSIPSGVHVLKLGLVMFWTFYATDVSHNSHMCHSEYTRKPMFLDVFGVLPLWETALVIYIYFRLEAPA